MASDSSWLRVLNAFTRPFLDRSLRDLPFPVQLRRRLERLGPTYIKLGQILSLREDILPKSITAGTQAPARLACRRCPSPCSAS